MYSNAKLAKAVNRALIASAASFIAMSNTAIAEEADSQAKEFEKIQVTGSRIKRADMETASPVTIIGASDIAKSGATTLDGVLQQMTSVGGAMTNPGVNNGSGGNATVNLRGLGASRTLVLVNGRRMIPSGIGAASTVDLNTIPLAMIKRIEVLKDGASAVYGTDAVAGVVNVILKDDMDGLDFNVNTGISGHGDAEETAFDITMGSSTDRSNIVMSLGYTKRGSASQADRDFSKCPISEQGEAGNKSLYCNGSSYNEGGHIWGNRNHGITPSGPNGEYAVGDSGHYGHYVEGPDGNPQFKYHDEAKKEANLSGKGGSYHPFGSDDAYNYSEDSYLYTPMERINLTAVGSFWLTDTTQFFAEGMYTKRWSEQQMAPQPIWNSSPWVYDPISAGGWMTDDLLGYVQPGEEISYGRRMTDVGTRDFAQVVDTLRAVVGFKGEFDNGFTWETSYNKGRNDSVDTLANLINMGAVDEAVQNQQFDPFLQESWQGESIAPYVYTELNSGGSEMDMFSASIAGELAEVEAGYIGFAAGYEHRKESAYYTPDSLTSQGMANDPPVDPTSGSFTVDEVYAELAIPLAYDKSWADNLDMSAAVRYFDYSTFGDDLTWKLGLTWKINSELMLRGVASTAFRAPTVDELYGGRSPSFEQITHPATEETQAEVTVGGNENLTPEEAEIYTVGLVYEPGFVDGLSLTVDYYDIDITNAITTVDANYVANQCMNEFGQMINTDTALCQSAGISMDARGIIAFDNLMQNVGGVTTSGIDVNVNYKFEGAGLDWTASLDSSFLLDYQEIDQEGNAVAYDGYITSGIGSFAKHKSNFSLTAARDDWSVTWDARYISGMDSMSCADAPAECYAPTVDSVMYHDVSATYYTNNGWEVSVGVNNLFDKEPPYYSGNNEANTDPYTYDTVGRYFFVNARFRF